jgi:uncharacterized membrane protein
VSAGSRGSVIPLSTRHVGFLACAGLAVIAADVAGASLAPVRALAGLVLALFVPGAAVILAIRPPFVAPTAALVLAFPLSLAVLALTGVVLDRSPWGLRPLPLMIGSLFVSALLLAVSAYRDVRRPEAGPRTRGAQASRRDTRVVVGSRGGQVGDRESDT